MNDIPGPTNSINALKTKQIQFKDAAHGEMSEKYFEILYCTDHTLNTDLPCKLHISVSDYSWLLIIY